MEQTDKIRRNEAIALFMELPKLEGHEGVFTINAGESNWYNTEVKYDSDWSWLMPVGKKALEVIKVVDKSDPGTWTYEGPILGAAKDFDINKLFLAVSDFCIWYNENKSKL